MASQRVVLDTNIYISGFVFRGKPAHLLQRAESSEFCLLTSRAIRQETERVLSEKFKWSPIMIAAVCMPLWRASQNIEPSIAIDACIDPDDNRILECADAGQADYIVSGDHHLLDMKQFQGIPILRIDDFLNLIRHFQPSANP
jgi:putative PIN family toxin of toxin-antitoxin system